MARPRDPNRKINQIHGVAPHLGAATPAVRELTVQDLHDLETKFKGEATGNATVEALTVDDLQSLENVFQAQRQDAAKRAQREGAPGPTEAEPIDWSISCCSCTPCCCCAAAEVDPFAA